MALQRERLKEKANGGGNYFAAPKQGISFIKTGCTLLDLALGGGWAEGRIANVVGDKSSGKTLLMIEAAANFAAKYKKGLVHYREAEAAFDDGYAEALGMPLDRVDFGPEEGIQTIEELFDDLSRVLDKAKGPTLYIVDSLDALSDDAEMDRDMNAGSYGTEKAKKLSQLFRRKVRIIGEKQLTLLIVSQVRSKIGLSFGRSTTRSGGRALDFYASQVLYLTQTGTLTKTVSGVKRPVGIKIKAKVDKNKIALPFREVDFRLRFGFGIDDALASLLWLKEVKSLREAGVKEGDISDFALAMMDRTQAPVMLETLEGINKLVAKRWFEIEHSFLPTRRKYGE